MKPSWRTAPIWANYLAMDGDGRWWWYQVKPEIEPEQHVFVAKGGKVELASAKAIWKESVEGRPAEEMDPKFWTGH